MGSLSDITSGKLGVNTTIGPNSGMGDIWSKAFCENNGCKQEPQENLNISNGGVQLNVSPVKYSETIEFIQEKYSPERYHDDRAYLCDPAHHLVRESSPSEIQMFLRGEYVHLPDAVSNVLIDPKAREQYCFFPETPHYLDMDTFRNGHDISESNLASILENHPNWENVIKTSFFPTIENLQVVYETKDAACYEDAHRIEGYKNVDVCLGSCEVAGLQIANMNTSEWSESEIWKLVEGVESGRTGFEDDIYVGINYPDGSCREYYTGNMSNEEFHEFVGELIDRVKEFNEIDGRDSLGMSQEFEYRMQTYSNNEMSIISVEGVDTTDMDNGQISELIDKILDARENGGFELNEFLGENPEYHNHYDTSTLPPEILGRY